MDPDSLPERPILEWDESEVHAWLSSLGYSQYEAALQENNISGFVLSMLDMEGLKAVGVSTVGQRLSILKAVYQAKLVYNVPIEEDDYVPPSEIDEHMGNITLEKLYDIVMDQAQRLQNLEEENRRLNDTLQLFLDEFNQNQASQTQPENTTLHRQQSFKWEPYPRSNRSPTKPDGLESPHPSPHQLEHVITQLQSNGGPIEQPQHSPASRMTGLSSQDSPGPSSTTPRPHRTESAPAHPKVTLNDPTWKVLPAALKKYKITNDTWQNYAMFICYGSGGSNRIERCLSYDEKPLLLFQKLKDARKEPVFVLKHIKDIRSPIAVAQQKHATRKQMLGDAPPSFAGQPGADQAQWATSSPGGGLQANATVNSRPSLRASPSRLEVGDPATGGSGPALAPSASAQPSWLEVMSPTVSGSDAGTAPTPTSAVGLSTLHRSASGKFRVGTASATGDGEREMPLPSAGVSYAVAIYPYMAEQDDEFDVVVGDTFVILSRARGWWVVQRDPTGSGIVDTDTSKQGWVPAGCLLETNVPVASAIAEATAAKASTSGSPPASPVSKTPILPLSIISTSFPGIALMDYTKRGDEELDLQKDDALRVFKRYNHWSYAVKEEGGDRGWVPSWFIGKVSSSGAAPTTPNLGHSPAIHLSGSISLDAGDGGGGHNQVSPMSSAFPPVQRIGTVP